MARQKGQKVGGQFVPMLHQMLDCVAWRSLSPIARLVYIALRRRTRPETNGRAFLSIRDAADECGVHRNTITRAFWDLQAAGFIVATELGHLGWEGRGKATTWRLTELGFPGGGPTKDYLKWSPGNDFGVVKAASPTSQKQKPGTNEVHPRHNFCAVLPEPVTKEVPPCHQDCAVSGDFGAEPVTPIVPHLESTRRGRVR